jgi:hypothetical protein
MPPHLARWPNSAQADHATDIRILNSINPHSLDTATAHWVDPYLGFQGTDSKDMLRSGCHTRNGAVLVKSLAPVRKTRKEAEYRDY